MCKVYKVPSQTRSAFLSGPLKRHQMSCQGTLFVINNALPEKEWHALTKSVDTLELWLNKSPPETKLEKFQVEKAISYLQDIMDENLKDAQPTSMMTTNVPNPRDPRNMPKLE